MEEEYLSNQDSVRCFRKNTANDDVCVEAVAATDYSRAADCALRENGEVLRQSFGGVTVRKKNMDRLPERPG